MFKWLSRCFKRSLKVGLQGLTGASGWEVDDEDDPHERDKPRDGFEEGGHGLQQPPTGGTWTRLDYKAYIYRCIHRFET